MPLGILDEAFWMKPAEEPIQANRRKLIRGKRDLLSCVCAQVLNVVYSIVAKCGSMKDRKHCKSSLGETSSNQGQDIKE